MIRSFTLLSILFVTLFLVNCKSNDPVTPAPTATELLTRKWDVSELYVQTDAKRYTIPADKTDPNGNIVTFSTGGVYSYSDNKVAKKGSWALSNGDKTITTTDAEGQKTTLQITSLTSSAFEFASAVGDATKEITVTDPSKLTESQVVVVQCSFLLLSLDKQYGGTIDFTKEPKPKTVQIINRGKAL